MDVNLKGLIYGAHIDLWQFWAQGGGTLINVGSMDSEVPLAYQASYAATKAAVLSLSRSLTEELRLAGNEAIKIGTIMLCAVDTPWWTHAANYSGHAPRIVAMDDPQIVGDAIIAACTDPKEQRPTGVKAHASNISHQLFPSFTETIVSSHRTLGDLQSATSPEHDRRYLQADARRHNGERRRPRTRRH